MKSTFVIVNLFLTIVSSLDESLWSFCTTDTHTGWNKKNVGQHLKAWISSVNVPGSKSPYETRVTYYTASNSYDAEKVDKVDKTILESISKLDHSTGQPVGKAWKVAGRATVDIEHHAGYLYGRMGRNGEISGKKVVYLYPDLKTALVGHFINGTMLAAKETHVVAERCKNGLKEIQVAKPKDNSPFLKFRRPNHIRIEAQPTVRDPYEHKYIYIADGLKEDGLFAKRPIKAGDIVAYYSGFVFPNSDIQWYNMTRDEMWDFHRNLMSLRGNQQMNIPKGYWSVAEYRATLGHKANHSFTKINSYFGFVYHPRFGNIRCLIASKDIQKGEEIFVHYGYQVTSNAPQWYLDVYNKEMK